MNIVNFRNEKSCIDCNGINNLFKLRALRTIRALRLIALIFLELFVSNLSLAWDVDFSRRTEFNQVTDRNHLIQMPVSNPGSSPLVTPESSNALIQKIIEPLETQSDIVVLVTEKGFVPSSLRLRKNGSYRFHVVNVNGKEKNVSFIVDAFSEHHSTYFGEDKGFTLNPKVDGIFSYQCPELGIQGQIVVLPTDRKPATAP